MRLEVIDQGFISHRKPGSTTAVATGPRCILTEKGELVCTYMLESKFGLVEFKPMIARSNDGGISWVEQGFIWPNLKDKYSMWGSISKNKKGELFFFGHRTVIETPGESMWCEKNQGLKENELFWSSSKDNGMTWGEPSVIPMPINGAAEAGGAMCIGSDGTWFCCYAPYNTFNPEEAVDRNQVVFLYSRDRGVSWYNNSMMRFDDENSSAAEAWVIELSDGRLLGTSWHMNMEDEIDYPNAYSLSLDRGLTWGQTLSTGIMGQSTALAPLSDSKALFIYNQRKHGDIGVWLAIVHPTSKNFGIELNQLIWKAETCTQSNLPGEHSNWTDFSFGEPSITVLPDNMLLAVLWCIQPSGRGIYYIKLKLHKKK